MLIVNGFWGMFCETEVREVLFVETPSVAILNVATGVKTVTIPVLETDERGVVGCFTVLVPYSFVWLEVIEVIFPERISKNVKTGAMT